MSLPTPPSAPYAHSSANVQRTMALVMLALTPSTLYGLYIYGWPAVFLFALTILSALAAEAFSLALRRKPIVMFLGDGSAALSGWLVAATLPPWAPWWVAVLGGLIAIIIGKQIFGGLGQNVFNPAMVARVMLLVSFPVELTRFVDPKPLFSQGAPDFSQSLQIVFGQIEKFDTISSASLLDQIRTVLKQGGDVPGGLAEHYQPMAMLIGDVPGSLGETSALLILLGGLFLLYKRIITWHTPAAMIASIALIAAVMNLIDPARYPGPVYHVLSGALLLGAFFIATDYVTAPVTNTGRLIFGAGAGALVYVIRTWTVFPEGVAFAVLLMNALTPVIDFYIKPRIYGRNRAGEPLPGPDDAG
ncbi:MAG: electron transporter RnfD [Hyphomicrobiales bacterium]|nr:MAG: electron transporter RnfD [Hyphomicrobiales bacterium]